MTDAQSLSQAEWDTLREDARQALPDAVDVSGGLPAVLLRYQAKLLQTTAANALTVYEKSRRTGITWAAGADAVLSAAAARNAGGMDVFYMGYNLEMAREFIDVCAMWAKAFIPAAGAVEETIFRDDGAEGAEKDINAFRIRFASGHQIIALPSRARSLRGMQGYVIIDEAAFHEDLAELLKAAMALLMWGGKVLVVSTHDGADNPFNELIQEVRSERRAGAVLRTTLDDAIGDGLYERIALVTGQEQTEEARAAWRQGILSFYGEDADEELHCIAKAGTGAYLSGAAVEACMVDGLYVARLTCPDAFELRPLEERRRFVEQFLIDKVGPAAALFDEDRNTAIGVDFGRSSDLTVIKVGQEQSNLHLNVPLVVELKNCPIEQQKQIVTYIAELVPRFLGGKFDATGNGLALAEWAQEEWGHDRIEGVKITQAWYLENGPKLKQHVEDRSLTLPRDKDIKDDIRSIRLIRGIPTIPDIRTKGRHGDSAVALMMLIAALKDDYEEFGYATAPHLRSRYAPGVGDNNQYFEFGGDDDDDISSGRFGEGAI